MLRHKKQSCVGFGVILTWLAVGLWVSCSVSDGESDLRLKSALIGFDRFEPLPAERRHSAELWWEEG